MWFRNIFHLDNLDKEGRLPRDKDPSFVSGLDGAVFAQLDRLRIQGSRDLMGGRIGVRSSHRRKPAQEFREFRMYVPGDDIRFVDWRASARHENIFIRQGELPKDADVYLLMDCSNSMAWEDGSKRKTELAIATVLGYSAITQGDHLSIFPYGGKGNTEFGPVSGKGNISAFIRYLNQLKYGEPTSLLDGVQKITRTVSRGGVLFILSDLLEKGDLAVILGKVPAPRWWVNVIHLLHRKELVPDLCGLYELEDDETGTRNNFDITSEALKVYSERMSDWRKKLELACIEKHHFYTMIPSDIPLDREVVPALRKAHILVDL